MRFAGQGYEIAVSLPDAVVADGESETLRSLFFDQYGRIYGDRSFSRDADVEMVHFRIKASVKFVPASFEALEKGSGDPASAERPMRNVYFPETRGFTPCKVYDRYALKAGDKIAGPAIVEERESTVVIPPDSTALVDEEGNIVVDLTE
jgi:N-methylhydantoinase A